MFWTNHLQGIKAKIFLFKKMHIPYTFPYKYKHPNLRKNFELVNLTNHEKGPNDQNKVRYQGYNQIKAI